ncbi:collagen alpha-2(I) chain-like [Cervus elaphus]|uniref:collagen alpha-2(I) chain-like n=1 Tax=Cervus elaphus TaxID=9860 RepID=UPI001CC2F9CB|nr:collagen alpha-2(I) chain-like [Cervus elaphus]
MARVPGAAAAAAAQARRERAGGGRGAGGGRADPGGGGSCGRRRGGPGPRPYGASSRRPGHSPAATAGPITRGNLAPARPSVARAQAAAQPTVPHRPGRGDPFEARSRGTARAATGRRSAGPGRPPGPAGQTRYLGGVPGGGNQARPGRLTPAAAAAAEEEAGPPRALSGAGRRRDHPVIGRQALTDSLPVPPLPPPFPRQPGAAPPAAPATVGPKIFPGPAAEVASRKEKLRPGDIKLRGGRNGIQAHPESTSRCLPPRPAATAQEVLHSCS